MSRPPKTDILPGFVWDPKTARFRVLTGGYGQKAGTFVARRRVLELLEAKISEGQMRLQALTQAFMEGHLTAAEWQVAFAQQLKTLYLQQAALGAGGWDRLGPADWGRIGGYLRGEYRRLVGFAQDIIDGRPTLAQALMRAGMYAGKARGMFFSTNTRAHMKAGFTEERRYLGAAEHCEVCIDYAAMGWMPIGTFPEPGTHPFCWGNCKCVKEYR